MSEVKLGDDGELIFPSRDLQKLLDAPDLSLEELKELKNKQKQGVFRKLRKSTSEYFSPPSAYEKYINNEISDRDFAIRRLADFDSREEFKKEFEEALKIAEDYALDNEPIVIGDDPHSPMTSILTPTVINAYRKQLHIPEKSKNQKSK